MRAFEHIRHAMIGTPLDPLARGVRRWHTSWKIRGTPEIHDAMFEDDLLKEVCGRCVRDGMNCVDIGAHLGAMTQELLELSPTGKHTAVEPTPYKAAWLKQKYPNVQIINAALAETSGQATFYHQRRNSGYSGLAVHVTGMNDSTHIDQISVNLRTLDEVIPEDRVIHFMKIDVEGAELRVLRGARRVLERDRPTFIFECTNTGLPANGVTADMVHQHLADLGYAIRTPRQFLEDGGPLNAAELDDAMQYPFRAFSFVASPVG